MRQFDSWFRVLVMDGSSPILVTDHQSSPERGIELGSSMLPDVKISGRLLLLACSHEMEL